MTEEKERFKAYHEKNPAWGVMHIVLDDGNYEDHCVEFCIKVAKENGDLEGLELAEILLKKSWTQRKKISKL